jgi:hypothetical protein
VIAATSNPTERCLANFEQGHPRIHAPNALGLGFEAQGSAARPGLFHMLVFMTRFMIAIRSLASSRNCLHRETVFHDARFRPRNLTLRMTVAGLTPTSTAIFLRLIPWSSRA